MLRFVICLGLLIPQETLRVKVSLVTTAVRVTDSRGRSIQDLKLEDFTVLDNGVPQKIEFFSNQEQAITLGIVFDRSSSMEYQSKMKRAKEAARALVRGTHQGSEFFYVTFDHNVRLAADFTTDAKSVESAIEATTIGGGTSLYDGIVKGLEVSREAQWARQALVIISDGADNYSTKGLQDVIRMARESEMQIYTIGYFGVDEDKFFRAGGQQLNLTDGRIIDNPRRVLQKLANDSGAESYFPRSDKELAKAIEEIADDLRTQYTIAYYPNSPESANRYHELRVAVRGGRYSVRARAGYVAQE